MAEEKDTHTIFETVIQWFKELADWVQENLGDPVFATALREDLGLKPGANIPPDKLSKLKQGADELDPDKIGFLETAAEITSVYQDLKALSETLTTDNMTFQDVVYIIARLVAVDSLRLHVPAAYAIGQALLFISSDLDEKLTDIDPAPVLHILKGEPRDPGDAERAAQRWSALTGAAVTLLEPKIDELLGPDAFNAYYGWDPAPGSTTPVADLVSARTLTLMIGAPGLAAGQLGITLIAALTGQGGPGVFVSLSGSLNVDKTVGRTKYSLQTSAASALSLFIPFKDSAAPFSAQGDLNLFARLGLERLGGNNQPAILLGEPGKTRLEIGKIGLGLELSGERAAFRFALSDANLIVSLAEADGFLRSLASGDIKIGFSIGLIADTKGGIHLEGGSRLGVTIPVGKTVLNVFTIHHIDLALGPGGPGRDLGIEVSGAFALSIGPFKASVDRLGMLFEISFREGNMKLFDLDLGFKPPNGVGLSLDAGVVKGGGYLFIDQVRGEYAGALELKIGPVGVKAIAILSTRMPDGSQGWSLLVIIYGQFPPIQLSWGFTLTGVGGLIGLQHSIALDALQSGLSTGALDDVLFPKDPVADAPRIINRLRLIFPATARVLIIGPFLELGWGTPNLVTVRLGVIMQIDNVINGNGSVSLSKVVLLGQVLMQVPMGVEGDLVVLKLLADFIGYLDLENKSFGFVARLRDSRLLGRLELAGMLVVRFDFGDQPTFILSAGGFHPKFKDLPSGMPSPIDRLSVAFSIGVIKVKIQGYFALTPATIQAGAEVSMQAKLGPVEISGNLGFDAILFRDPQLHFIVDIRASVAVKFKGHSLASVGLDMTLEGPGLWRARGKISFSILWWDVSKEFDESWGQEPALPDVTTNVGQLVQAAMANPESWSAQLPAGGEAMITLGPVTKGAGLLAHPLGRLTVTQRVVPFGLKISRFGDSRVAGADRFEIAQVKVGVRDPGFEPAQEFFSRAQFQDLPEEQKLTSPSFERFGAGAMLGSGGFSVPSAAAVPAKITYETFYIDVEQPHLPPRRERSRFDLDIDMLTWQARHGAAAQSALLLSQAIRPSSERKVKLGEVRLAAVDKERMQVDPGVSLPGQAATSYALALQALEGKGNLQIVEEFEIS